MSGRAGALPVRPDAATGAVRPVRRWLPVWVVAGVIVVTVLGGFVTAAALPVPDVPAVSVSALTVHPPPGWAIVRRDRVALTSPAGTTVEATFVQLSRGGGALDLLAIDGLGGEAEDAAHFYVDEVLSRQLERLRVSALGHVVLGRGVPAARFAYIGTEPEGGAAIEGAVTAVVGPSGAVAVFDGWGFEGQLELIAEELERMIDGAEVR
ncbi:MAG TPA: hypothetical protein VE800_00715 [Actinomycetota bacterium]|nr:hypothetical protein [Actinomycetota bacterium]